MPAREQYAAKLAPAVAELLKPYLEVVGALNEPDTLKLYPGSPASVRAWLRSDDRLPALQPQHPPAAGVGAAGLVLGGVACLVAAAGGGLVLRRMRPPESGLPEVPAVPDSPAGLARAAERAMDADEAATAPPPQWQLIRDLAIEALAGTRAALTIHTALPVVVERSNVIVDEGTPEQVVLPLKPAAGGNQYSVPLLVNHSGLPSLGAQRSYTGFLAPGASSPEYDLGQNRTDVTGLTIWATGQPGGCNTGSLNSWSGTLYVTTTGA